MSQNTKRGEHRASPTGRSVPDDEIKVVKDERRSFLATALGLTGAAAGLALFAKGCTKSDTCDEDTFISTDRDPSDLFGDSCDND